MSSPPRGLGARLEALGHAIFYGMLLVAGQTGAYLLLWPVITVYVLGSRKIHRLTGPYLRRRFPDHGRLARWRDTHRIMLSFGRVLVDRAWLGLRPQAALQGSLEGQDELLALAGEGRGLVLLTAHVGNWQSAMAHLTGFQVPINSLMHYQEEAVAKHYFDLRRKVMPCKIIKSDSFMGGLVEATAALQRGEVVTIMGDRYAGGPFTEVELLGAKVRLPAAAYSLAAATGSPVAVLLAAKTGRRQYCLKLWEVFRPEPSDRENRRRDMAKWAQRFAGALEGYLREYPYQWYNFFDFWSQ
ncbi:MAG: lysophospholipid acyltransferase family protein [Desulfobulbaceae bacterium]|nr:lysophospholipid acyltransferase family protein [Desulfobulbaceae bacterium]